MKKLLIILTVTLVSAVCLLLIFWQTSEDSIRISADQLVEDYISDEQSANEKYAGKFLIIEGIVNKINRKNNIVWIGTDDSRMISCSFEELPQELTSGKVTTIKGYCTGKLFDVQMTECRLL